MIPECMAAIQSSISDTLVVCEGVEPESCDYHVITMTVHVTDLQVVGVSIGSTETEDEVSLDVVVNCMSQTQGEV